MIEDKIIEDFIKKNLKLTINKIYDDEGDTIGLDIKLKVKNKIISKEKVLLKWENKKRRKI